MITVRGCCSEKDGKIHTDSKTKIISLLIYLNSSWGNTGGRNINSDVIQEQIHESDSPQFRLSSSAYSRLLYNPQI